MNPPLARNPHVEVLPLIDLPVYDRVRGAPPPEHSLRMIPFPSPLRPDCEKLLNALLLQRRRPEKAAYVESKEGGKNSFVVYFCHSSSFLARKHCIRTPRYVCFTHERQYPIYHPVKTLAALTKIFGVHGVGLPMPNILAYDSTFQNAISCPYVVMEMLSGTTLQEVYQTMQRPPSPYLSVLKYRRLAREIAHFIAKRESVKILGYGVLRDGTDMEYSDRDYPRTRYGLAVDELNIDTKNIPKFVFSEFISHLATKERIRSSGLEAYGQRYRGTELTYVWEAMLGRGLLRDQDSTLWHPDFHPRNILTLRYGDDVGLSSVLDWDNALALPRIMTREPPSFLWNQPGLLTPEEARAVKGAFDDTIEQLIPGYIEDAYLRSRILTRALGMYSLYGPQWKLYQEITFDEFLLECEDYFWPDLQFPNV
ncbi:hypothetical protein EAE96_005929 [Botrytis aclada]|nr:hypothetical protein EAE96_005929 [Botrytis aclada]